MNNSFKYGDVVRARVNGNGPMLLRYLWERGHEIELAADIPNHGLDTSDELWKFYGRVTLNRNDVEIEYVGHGKGNSIVLASQPETEATHTNEPVLAATK